jgi:hypothetical protein
MVGCCLAQFCIHLLQSTAIVVASCTRQKKIGLLGDPCNQQHIKIWLLHPCVLQWLAYCPRTLPSSTTAFLATSKSIIVVASLAIWHKQYGCCCRPCDQQRIIKLIIALGRVTSYPSNNLCISLWLDACVLAIPKKIWSMLSLLAAQHEKNAHASDSIKIPILTWKQSHKPTTLCVAGVFNPFFIFLR